ncbi:MAG: hypothetical protein M3P30_00165 [Chloroflexota bacterium]|nr:hypothetical protein [Chloroflexota bacterium]
MKLALALSLATAIAFVAMASSSCGAVASVKDRLQGGPSATPSVTRTPRPTSTATPTPTPTVTPTPTATPTPALPPNPQGLLRWASLPVSFCISAAGDGGYVPPAAFIDAVERAFTAWGLAWRNDGACGPVASPDGVNEIGWGSLDGNTSRRQRSYEAGLTEVNSSVCTAGCDLNDKVKITEADITIDSAPPREFRSETCLYSTMLHEAGHFLGLEHLDPPAVMAAETSGCPSELTIRDRAVLAERYGDLAGG